MVHRRWLWVFVVGSVGLIAVLGVAHGCASNSAPVPPGGSCGPGDECADGTMCVTGRCVAYSCMDADGDGAGTGPSCTAFDCDDSDPTVPSATEACDDRDDDCDGATDEGCPCLEAGVPQPDGSTRPCGAGTGDCMGVQSCESGMWGECSARAPAEAEVCFNDVDDNCDGTMDEGCCPDGEFGCDGTAMCSSNGMCL